MSYLLVVDDESEIREVICAYLQRAGFATREAKDGETALTAVSQALPRLVVLDRMLPGISGDELCQRFHAMGLPVVLLTAKDAVDERVKGLSELGADDYIPKPFSPKEVVARVEAVLRRVASSNSAQHLLLAAGRINIDREAHVVLKDGQEIPLTPAEYALLETLGARPGRTFTRAQLLERYESDTGEVYERTVDAHIKNLRHKIEDDPQHPRWIETVFGVGYRWHERS
ncbi:MAG: response regulator transcription factor [Firmicutes bacterium]|nr:response regulator transcription factor [Bacillota bacterium]